MTLLTEQQDLMVKHRFRPNKKLGQHFIVNEAALEKMLQLADLKPSDTVLEIGAGTGFLTRELQKKCKVVAVELDEKLCSLLKQELPAKNLQLLCGDFLKVPLPAFNKAVALPPYSHSAAIVYRMLEHGMERAVLVFQREFAEKVAAQPGFREYNALSVLSQYAFDVKIMQRLESGSFFPRPEGESRIVLMEKTQRHGAVQDREAFTLFTKSIFRLKNKNLKNALVKSWPFIKKGFEIKEKEFRERVHELDMHNVKVNLISVKELVQIFNQLTGISPE